MLLNLYHVKNYKKEKEETLVLTLGVFKNPINIFIDINRKYMEKQSSNIIPSSNSENPKINVKLV